MPVTSSNSLQDACPKSSHWDNQAFGSLKGEVRACFKALGMEANHRPGATLFTEGEPAQYVYIVRSGRIKLSVTSRNGKTMILWIAEPGQVLGLSAALTARQHEVSAEALEPCHITAIRAKDLLNFLAKYPEASLEMMQYALQEYQLLLSDICRLALPATVAGRLANLLLDCLKRRGQAGQARPRFTMAFTHEEIAGMAGTSRETVSRILKQFQRDKVISIRGSSFTVLRPEVLERLTA